MKIDKSVYDDYATLTLKGEFDTFYCPHLLEEVDALVERGISYLVLNMRLVKFVNSTALGAIIKVHKRCRAEGGDLVIAQPSSFVRDIIGKVGIDQLVGIYDDEQAATKHIIKELNSKELAGDAPVDSEKIMIKFPDATRNDQIGGRKTLLGTMANVDGQKLQFTWPCGKAGMSAEKAETLFYNDSEVHLKFQVKLIKKSYFEVVGVVSQAEAVDDETIRVTASYKKISTADQTALNTFAEDMAFLKKQLPGS